MSEDPLFLAYLVVIPLLLLLLALRSRWRPLRVGACAFDAGWWGGLAVVAAVNRDCAGNLLYGFTDCGRLPPGAAGTLANAALLVSFGAVILYAVMVAAWAVHAVSNRPR